MKINFNQPKYIFPLIAFPFLCFFFYLYQQNSGPKVREATPQEGIQSQLGPASNDVQKKAIEDKLEAFNDQFREADGNTALSPIDQDEADLDSIDRMMKQRFGGEAPVLAQNGLPPGMMRGSGYSGSIGRSKEDRALADALSRLQQGNAGNYNPGGYTSNSSGSYGQNYPGVIAPGVGNSAAYAGLNPGGAVRASMEVKAKDPMELFKAQMQYMDSISKAADPQYQEEKRRLAEQEKAEKLRRDSPALKVAKESAGSGVFNTVRRKQAEDLITAVIDESLTGYAGSRIRLRLLDDIRAGGHLVSKGTYLYALISGFSDQRVRMTVTSVLLEGKVLPVKLELYDMDGLEGLYVPESAFRDFSKELGGNSMQGVNIQGNSATASQFLMSSVDKVFQSTSSAIASIIRKNKAKIKYNSYIYLIDSEELQKVQSSN